MAISAEFFFNRITPWEIDKYFFLKKLENFFEPELPCIYE